jgi:hypothetical protein
LCKEWFTTDQLGAVVSRSLTQLIKRHPRSGWVKATTLASPEATAEILALTKRVQELEAEARETKIPPPEVLAALSQENDLIRVTFSYEAYDGKKSLGRQTDEVSVTWNQIIARIAPIIALTAGEIAVKNAIGRLIEEQFKFSLPKRDAFIKSITMAETSVQTIKIQLIALGLITVGKEGYSNTWQWTLTEHGKEKMFQVLSVKRPVPERLE